MMDNKKYTFGTSVGSWQAGSAQTITFVVTDDCNLRCKYCYITHKKSDNKMSFDTAKAFIDRLLTTEEMRYAESVILEFIGGEPMMEAKLIDEIADYFKLRAFELEHSWYWNYRISICTNGVNYSSPDVQKLINKNKNKMSVTISIDGNKEKHDLQRVFPDGSGSFDKVDKNIDLWLSQFRGSTKVTFASDDLPLLYDSIISLWNRGIKEVSSNVVFENVWKDGDDKILEKQLKKLADYVIDNKLYDKGYYCSFFNETLGYPYGNEDMDRTYCGAGKMIALAPNGNIYPCIRYYGYSLNNHKEWSVGDIHDGIDMEKVRPFVLSTNRLQSDSECLNCDVASGCAFCQGFNYDDSTIATNFHRAKYICKMHKATVRANNYFFAKLYNMHDIERENYKVIKKSLYFLLSDDYVTYCSYQNNNQDTNQMKENVIIEGLNYTQENFMRPIFVHSKNGKTIKYREEYLVHDIVHIVPIKHYSKAKEQGFKRILPTYDIEDVNNEKMLIDNIILNVKANQIKKLGEAVYELIKYSDRININITELDKHFDEEEYNHQLKTISDKIVEIWEEEKVLKEVNLLTDVLLLDNHDNCQAGENTFVLSPMGKIYTCCAVFSNNQDNFVGDVKDGINKEYGAHLYKLESSNLCKNCDAYQCKNCVEINRENTNEYNVSPAFQCRKSHIEKAVSLELMSKLKECNVIVNIDILGFKGNDFLDPIVSFFKGDKEFKGYYKYKR